MFTSSFLLLASDGLTGCLTAAPFSSLARLDNVGASGEPGDAARFVAVGGGDVDMVQSAQAREKDSEDGG